MDPKPLRQRGAYPPPGPTDRLEAAGHHPLISMPHYLSFPVPPQNIFVLTITTLPRN